MVSQASHFHGRASPFSRHDGTNAEGDVLSEDSTPDFGICVRARFSGRPAPKSGHDELASEVKLRSRKQGHFTPRLHRDEISQKPVIGSLTGLCNARKAAPRVGWA